MNQRCYVYKLIDKLNGKYYVGSNYNKKCDPSWLGKTYFTSSKLVSSLFRNDPERFEKHILFIGSAEKVLAFETKLLVKLNARKDLNSYNCHNNENKLNSKKIGELTFENKIGVHGRSLQKLKEDAKKAGKISCQIRHKEKDYDGKSKFAKRIGLASHKIRNSEGKSVRMIEIGKKTMAKLHAEKNSEGKSVMVMRSYECLECGYTHIAMMVGKHLKLSGHKTMRIKND